jgi:hypothetical protein
MVMSDDDGDDDGDWVAGLCLGVGAGWDDAASVMFYMFR